MRAQRGVLPREVEIALLALASALHTDVFLPLRRARTVRGAQATLAEVRAPFRALWGAIVATLVAGLDLGRDSAAVVVETLLRDAPGLPSELWTSRLASGRLGRESLPFWAAAFDARVQAALAVARWPERRPWPEFTVARETELIECALDADLSIMLAVDVLAERRAVRLPPAVSIWLARRAHDNARRVFVMLATPLYRDAEARGG